MSAESQLFNHDPNRGKWASRYEFACAIVGNAVGLRSFALFSYYHQTCGGVAFLIPLYVMIGFITAPLIFTKVFMGQFSSTGFLSVFRVSMFYKGLGFIMLVLNIGSVIYFGMVSAYPIAMIHKLVNYEVPWNTTAIDEKFVGPEDRGIIPSILNNKSAPEAYFLKRLDDIEIGWNDVSLANPIMVAIPIIWLFVAVCLIKGVKSVGKVVYLTVGISFILLVIINIRNFFYHGHLEGAKFLSSSIDWSKLGTWETWMGCIILSIYMLGQGWGILVTMGSYNNFRESVKHNVAYLPFITMLLSLMGIAFAEYFGNFLKNLGVEPERAIPHQFNLAFLLYPDFTSYTNTSQGWAWIFYLMCFLFEFHSILIQTFAILTTLFDEFAQLRNYKLYVTGAFCLVAASIGIGFGSFGLYPPVDKLLFYAVAVNLVILSIEIVAFIWSGLNRIRFSRDIEFTFNSRFRSYEFYGYITPILLLCAFIWVLVTGMPWLPPQTGAWPAALSISFISLSFLCFPGYILYRFYFKAEGEWAIMMRESVKPKKWHPADESERLNYIGSEDKNSAVQSETDSNI